MFNWTNVSKNTVKANRLIHSYNMSSMYSLRDAYKTCSSIKQSAWDWCLSGMNDVNGYGIKVTSANTFSFCCAFKFKENDKEYLAYITPSYDYKIELGD